MTMTIQEMFTKAVRGLRRQKFKRCINRDEAAIGGTKCRYNGPRGTHCAWGHVDPRIPKDHEGLIVSGLRDARVGVAATLTTKQLQFAVSLQDCHDDATTPAEVEENLRKLGRKYRLKWPR
jgi:hypothetical protein